MAGRGPTTLSLPSFGGATRKLILWNVGVFFADAVLGLVLPKAVYEALWTHLWLAPQAVVHGQVWELGTYAFLPMGIMGTLFAMLTLWFTGTMLEDIRGARWLYELFFSAAAGGAVVATAICYTRLFGLAPELARGIGAYAGLYGLLIAVAVLLGDMEFLLFFLVRIKAKYMVALYILIDLATLLKNANEFSALLHLSGALCGYLFLRFVPRRGLAYAATERFYGMRNEYYRSKRRRAAKKFQVYMKEQNRDVHFDENGRYVDPDKDPTDKRWMN